MSWLDTFKTGGRTREWAKSVIPYNVRYAITQGKGLSNALQSSPEALGASMGDTGSAISYLQDRSQSNTSVPDSSIHESVPQSLIPYDTPSTNYNPSYYSGSGSSGGSSSSSNNFSQYLNGVLYTNPDDYLNAVNDESMKQYEKQKSQIERQYQLGLIDFDEMQNKINTSRKNIKTQQENLLRSYENNLNTLGENKRSALESQAGYFSNIAPDVQQSTQGTMAQQTEETYKKGLEDLNIQKAQNEESINQSLADLATSEGQIGRQKELYKTQYENNLQSLIDALNTKKDELANQRLEFANNLSTNLSGYNVPTTATTNEYDTSKANTALGNLAINLATPATAKSKVAYTTQTNQPTNEDILSYLLGLSS